MTNNYLSRFVQNEVINNLFHDILHYEVPFRIILHLSVKFDFIARERANFSLSFFSRLRVEDSRIRQPMYVAYVSDFHRRDALTERTVKIENRGFRNANLDSEVVGQPSKGNEGESEK